MIIWNLAYPTRLIDALQEKLGKTHSARALKRALEANICTINGRIERFASAKLDAGDEIAVRANWEDAIKQGDWPCPVLYEDADLLIIDKPAPLVSDSNYFAHRFKKQLWLAHRLDKETTGVLVLTKSARAASEFTKLFAKKTIEKEYLALVDGVPSKTDGVLRSTLTSQGFFQGQTIWGSGETGDFAETYWATLGAGPTTSLLQCRPTTGRTHQIRVQLAEMGHPIITDRQYATEFRSPHMAKRPLLHAAKITFEWKKKKITVEAPMPADMKQMLKESKVSLWTTGKPK